VCGRLALSTPPRWLAAWVAAHLDEPETTGGLAPRPMGRPGEFVPVVLADEGRRVLRAAWWGLPRASSGQGSSRRLINARAETLLERPTFRPLVAGGRCLVLADAFFEWTGPSGARHPLRVQRSDGTPLALAGLARPRPEGLAVAVVTVAAGPDLAGLHDRMPVPLAPADWPRWLAPVPRPEDAPLDLLRPAPDGSLVILDPEETTPARRAASRAAVDPSSAGSSPVPAGWRPRQGVLPLG
jgi:putative SOS response-associated peptidase YedK